MDGFPERGVPFVVYTGFDKLSELVAEGEPQVCKSANPDVLVATVAGLLQGRGARLG